MAQRFVGKWRLVKSENFDAFMKQIGLSYLERKIGGTLKPTVRYEVSEDGLHWVITTKSIGVYKYKLEFDLGREFEERLPNGQITRTLIYFDGQRLIQAQHWSNPNDRVIHCERFIDANGRMIFLVECEGVRCIRIYERMK